MNKHLTFLLGTVLFFLFVTPSVFSQDFSSTNSALPTLTTGVTLTVTPSTIATQSGTTIDFTVTMTPGDISVKAFDLAMTFDPNVIEILDVKKTPQTDTLIELNKMIKNSEGSLLFSLGVPLDNPDAVLAKAEAPVVTITVRTKNAGISTFSINREKTVIAAKNQEQNVLGSTTDAQIAVEAVAIGTAPTTQNSNLIPILLAGATFLVGLVIIIVFLVRKPKA